MTQSQPPPKRQSRNAKNPPIVTRNVGPVYGKLWRNDRADGTASLSATFARIYRDDNGDIRESYNFGGVDLLRLEKVIGQLHEAEQAVYADLKSAGSHATPQAEVR